MSFDVLKELGCVPQHWHVARLDSFDIRIRPHANLVRSEQHCVYGIVAAVTLMELAHLYARAQDSWGETYWSELVLVETADDPCKPALCYICPHMKAGPADAGHLDLIIQTANKFGFPSGYLRRLERFHPSKDY